MAGIRASLLTATLAALALPGSAGADTRVTSLQPWKVDNLYRVTEDLDGRAQPTVEPRKVINHVRAGAWVRIECQTLGESAYGSPIWDKVNGLYVPDRYVKTYSEGLLPGAPRCGVRPAPPPPAPAPAPVDRDHDGFFAGQDCNDLDPAIRPGAIELRGNQVDENCDGVVEDLTQISAGVSTAWRVRGARLRMQQLVVKGVGPGVLVELRCRGRRCPVRHRRIEPSRSGRVNVLAAIRRSRRTFRAGQTLEVRITAADRIGKVVRYKLRRGKAPTARALCLRPGADKPHRCR